MGALLGAERFQRGQVSQVDEGEEEGYPKQREVAGMGDAGRGQDLLERQSGSQAGED